MKLLDLIVEMAAKKICDKCGKSMSANHYWYKGEWKCKKQAQTASTETPPASEPVVTPTTTLPQPPVLQPSNQGNQPKMNTAVSPLETTVTFVAEALPILMKGLEKINKIASRIGAQPVKFEVLKTEYKPQRKSTNAEDGVVALQKMLTVRVQGSAPQVRAPDGTPWTFVGVITPSVQGQALLKLIPSESDNTNLQALRSTNPYYCDYCKTIRARNETFIIKNGQQLRQVGRNCLKDFLGNYDPHTLLNFFSWFTTPERLQNYLTVDGNQDDEFRGIGAGTLYYPIDTVLAATVTTLKIFNSYVPSSAAEPGVTPTVIYVREILGNRRTGSLLGYAESLRAAELIRSSEVLHEVSQIVKWFKNLPASQIIGNNFFENVKVMMDEGVVGSKMIGYIVGLYPAYQRAKQQASLGDESNLIKEWPEQWGSQPKSVDGVKAVITYVKTIEGAYGTSQLAWIKTADNVVATWKYSGRNEMKPGQEFTISGEFQKDDYHTPAKIRFVPNRKWLRSAF